MCIFTLCATSREMRRDEERRCLVYIVHFWDDGFAERCRPTHWRVCCRFEVQYGTCVRAQGRRDYVLRKRSWMGCRVSEFTLWIIEDVLNLISFKALLYSLRTATARLLHCYFRRKTWVSFSLRIVLPRLISRPLSDNSECRCILER